MVEPAVSSGSPGGTTAEVRAWALARGIPVASTGVLPRFVHDLYRAEAPGLTSR